MLQIHGNHSFAGSLKAMIIGSHHVGNDKPNNFIYEIKRAFPKFIFSAKNIKLDSTGVTECRRQQLWGVRRYVNEPYLIIIRIIFMFEGKYESAFYELIYSLISVL